MLRKRYSLPLYVDKAFFLKVLLFVLLPSYWQVEFRD
jgi:hypothetical protein